MTSQDIQPNSTGNIGSPSPHVWLRRLFYVACIIVFLLAILYLIYYNGKSIYANGI